MTQGLWWWRVICSHLLQYFALEQADDVFMTCSSQHVGQPLRWNGRVEADAPVGSITGGPRRVCRAWHVTWSVKVRLPGFRRAEGKENGKGVPAKGLKERRNRLPRNRGIASGESSERKLGGWDETDVGAVGNDAPDGVQGRYAFHLDSICRTAVYIR